MLVCCAERRCALRWLASPALLLKTRWHCVHVLCDGFDVGFGIDFGAGVALSAAGICWLSLELVERVDLVSFSASGCAGSARSLDRVLTQAVSMNESRLPML